MANYINCSLKIIDAIVCYIATIHGSDDFLHQVCKFLFKEIPCFVLTMVDYDSSQSWSSYNEEPCCSVSGLTCGAPICATIPTFVVIQTPTKTNAYTLPHTHTIRSLSLSLSMPQPLSLSLTPSQIHIFSGTLTLIRPHTPNYNHRLTLSPSHTHTHHVTFSLLPSNKIHSKHGNSVLHQYLEIFSSFSLLEKFILRVNFYVDRITFRLFKSSLRTSNRTVNN